MWASFASGRPTIVAGISAVPSIHVAISCWTLLAARLMLPRAAPYALAYALLIWIGSVQLGWHYATDGLAGILGMMGVWKLGCQLDLKVAAYFASLRGSPAIAG
jgi:predicted metal-binding membrane protein